MRKLTIREKFLLLILLILLLVSGYVLLFHMPLEQRAQLLNQQIADTEEVILVGDAKLEKQTQMQRELKALYEKNPNPISMSAYDNQQAVMFELNSILKNSQSYSLSFSTVDSSQTIVRRSISMQFTTANYDDAKNILQQLHDSQYRCLLGDVNISSGTADVSVTATITFFEHRFDQIGNTASQP